MLTNEGASALERARDTAHERMQAHKSGATLRALRRAFCIAAAIRKGERQADELEAKPPPPQLSHSLPVELPHCTRLNARSIEYKIALLQRAPLGGESLVPSLGRITAGWGRNRKAVMGRFNDDVDRYRARGLQGKDLWLDPAMWAIASYRFSHWLYVDRPATVFRLPLKVLAFLLTRFCVVFMEMDLDPQADIGGGLYIGHIGGVHINPGAVIGKNCDIAHRVTIGASAMGRQGIPVIGDAVYIGTGATLMGKIKVGDGAKIAANTLVMTNVPAGATVMGVPGRIVMRARPAVPPQSTKSAVQTTAPETVQTVGEPNAG